MLRFLIAFGFCLLFQSAEVYAQKTLERYENGKKKYQGRMINGTKVGTHTFWFEDGSKKRQEKYNGQGILILVKEWNEAGELIKDENPERGYELVRFQQFSQIQWTDVEGGIAISKVRGELSLVPISGLNKMVVHYATYLPDGIEIDSSFRTEQPITVDLDRLQLIEGFQLGLKFFEQGDNGFIKIPARLAYGTEGTFNVPPNSNLIFQVFVIKRSD